LYICDFASLYIFTITLNILYAGRPHGLCYKEIKGVKLPRKNKEGELYIETKLWHSTIQQEWRICQKNNFDILSIYKKASGSKVNYEKTKGVYIRAATTNRSNLWKIVCTKVNVKLLAFIMVIIYKLMRYGNQ
jgi:DNA-dependent RNA polymerase auxiliary subunit epsilon